MLFILTHLKAPTWDRRAHTLIFTGGLLWLVGALAGSDARASCGDYVTVGGRPGTVPADEHDMPPHNADEAAYPDGVPCRGPNCDRRFPSDPLPAPASTPQVEKLGCIISDSGGDDDRQQRRWSIRHAVPRDGFPVLIDHPPRQSARQFALMVISF